MKKRIVFIVMLAAALLLVCGTALAGGRTNPRRKHVEESLRWERIRNRPGLFLASGPSLTITCDETPTLTSPGQFTVTVENGGDSNWVFEYAIQDRGRDSGGYLYYGSEAVADNVFRGIPLYSAGEYRLYVYLYKRADLGTRIASARYDFTVEEMPGYPTLEEKAQAIVNECKVAGNAWETALNLHDWLTAHAYYDNEYEYYGADILFRGYGVCDAYSKAYRLLCETAGIPADRVISSAMNHAWNAIRLSGTWYHVDVTWDGPSGAEAPVSGEEIEIYFCLSDDVIYLDHTRFDVQFGNECPSLAMNYHIKKKTWKQFGYYKAGSMDTVIGFLRNELAEDNLQPEFYFDDGRWEYYWPEGGTDGRYTGPIRRAIYIYAMQRAEWEMADGDGVEVDIQLHSDDEVVSLRIVGWRIEETGTLTLPAKTTTIDEAAFEGTKATTAVIPAGCAVIPSGAFRNSGVRTVYIQGTVKEIAADAFEGCGRIIFVCSGRENEVVREYAEQAGDLVTELW